VGNKKKGKGLPLGNLADALLKAGVANKQAAHKAHVEKRSEEKALGKEGLAHREAELREATEEQRKQQIDAARAREDMKRDKDAFESTRALIKAHIESGGGNKRWFYVSRDGRIPFMDVADDVLRKLADGEAGVVESLGATDAEHVVVSGRQTLAALADFNADLVRFWNK
jgi:uncharacterized protein YaiL (DUF2058 family)